MTKVYESLPGVTDSTGELMVARCAGYLFKFYALCSLVSSMSLSFSGDFFVFVLGDKISTKDKHSMMCTNMCGCTHTHTHTHTHAFMYIHTHTFTEEREGAVFTHIF